MERLVTKTKTIERKGVFDKNLKRRFELTFDCKEAEKKKSILVIGLNDMWVHSPPLGAQANFNRMEKRDTM